MRPWRDRGSWLGARRVGWFMCERSCQAFPQIISSPSKHPSNSSLSLSLNQQQISNDKLSNVQATLLQEKGEGMASSPYAIFNPHLQIPGFDLGPWPRCLVALKTIPRPLGIQLGLSQNLQERGGAGLTC